MPPKDEAVTSSNPKGSWGTCSHGHRDPLLPSGTHRRRQEACPLEGPIRRAGGDTHCCQNHPTSALGWQLWKCPASPADLHPGSRTRGHASPGHLHSVASETKPGVPETHLQLLCTNSGNRSPKKQETGSTGNVHTFTMKYQPKGQTR